MSAAYIYPQQTFLGRLERIDCTMMFVHHFFPSWVGYYCGKTEPFPYPKNR